MKKKVSSKYMTAILKKNVKLKKYIDFAQISKLNSQLKLIASDAFFF